VCQVGEPIMAKPAFKIGAKVVITDTAGAYRDHDQKDGEVTAVNKATPGTGITYTVRFPDNTQLDGVPEDCLDPA
jgi:hypothetical protein